MKIISADVMGFCYGVKRALNLAQESGKGSYVLGELVNNPQVNQSLEELGIQTVAGLHDLKQGATVIFRSHGEPPASYVLAETRALQVIDATCPHVKKAQQTAKQLADEGFAVVVIGDRDHPEVQGLKGWAGSTVKVVGTEADIDDLPVGGRYGILGQTTCASETFTTLSGLIAAKAIEHKIIRTICQATLDRQTAAVELAKTVDIMVVVGGKNSANSRRLKELVQEHCKNTVFLETAAELTPELLKNVETAGITAGASTPDWIIEEVINKMQSMDEAIAQDNTQELSAGDIIEGQIVNIGKEEVFVDIKHKSDGVIPRAETALTPPDDLTEIFKVGEVLSLYVLNPDKEGRAVLSRIRAQGVLALEKLKDALENKDVVDVFVEAAVKGGLTCELFGMRGFIPASHTGLEHIEDLSAFVGQTLPAHVIELDFSGAKKKIILSRREILKQEKQALEKAMYAKIEVGRKYTGVVSRLTEFGAFVDLGGIDGLLHVSEISWQKIKHPSDFLKLNDQIQVIVKKIDTDNKKISLNMRDLTPDPWQAVIAGLKEGQLVEGKVSKLTKFGAFILLADDVEGLVHVSEIADERVESPEAVLKPGQEIKAKILKIDKQNKKISLSLVQAKKEEEKREMREHIGNSSELRTSIGSKFDLSKFFEK